jgi:hypothetical protein
MPNCRCVKPDNQSLICLAVAFRHVHALAKMEA